MELLPDTPIHLEPEDIFCQSSLADEFSGVPHCTLASKEHNNAYSTVSTDLSLNPPKLTPLRSCRSYIELEQILEKHLPTEVNKCSATTNIKEENLCDSYQNFQNECNNQAWSGICCGGNFSNYYGPSAFVHNMEDVKQELCAVASPVVNTTQVDTIYSNSNSVSSSTLSSNQFTTSDSTAFSISDGFGASGIPLSTKKEAIDVKENPIHCHGVLIPTIAESNVQSDSTDLKNQNAHLNAPLSSALPAQGIVLLFGVPHSFI